MRQFCFASFIKVLKEHAKDKKVSNEKFVGELFCYICYTRAVTNKNGENYWSSKEIASLLINRKEDIPAPIRQALLNAKIDKLCEGMMKFYIDYLNKLELDHLKISLLKLYKSDELLSKREKEEVDSIINIYILITYLLVETAKINNKITEIKCTIYKHGNNEINYLFDDIIKIGFNSKNNNKKKIVVIPVDADFHMHVSKIGERPVAVSENTIHGKWILRLHKFGYSDEEIMDLVNDGRTTNENIIGSTSCVVINNTEFYLLAISKFDENYIAHASKKDISNALKCLLRHYDKYGNGYEMCLPLIGTGSSRAKLSHKESLELIKSTLIENVDLLNGTINIVVYTKDQKEIEEFL